MTHRAPSAATRRTNTVADFAADVEKLLVDVGAVRLGDQRLQRRKDDEESSTSGIRQGTTTGDDDDSDWD
jgi:hypothetical protein